MSKLLHIETATKVCSAATSENGELISLKEVNGENYTHSESLTSFIQEVMEESNWSFEDLDAIVVTSGPGSYTGLRIGVSTAKGLCYALDKPLISIDSIQSIAALAHGKYPDQNICATIDARRMEVFSAIYNSKREILKSLSADIIDESSYDSFTPFVVVGDGASKLSEVWKDKNIEFDSEIISSSTGQIKIAFEKFKRSDFEDVAYFEPKYLKDFIGTKSKKKSF